MEKAELYDLFVSILKSRLNSERICAETAEKITPEILPALFRLSKAHDVAHIVGSALLSAELLSEGKAKDAFITEINLSVYRYETMRYELERIYGLLEGEKIKFMPLKGAVLRKFYPEPEMRSSCDIDIFVKPDSLDAAVRVLTGAGYTFKGKFAHDASLFSPSNVHLELHFRLDDSDKEKERFFSSAFDSAKKFDGYEYGYVMDDAMFVAYFSSHMAKHFSGGGCGVRTFMDIAVMEREGFFGSDYSELVKKTGSDKFLRAARDLAEVWFGDKEMTPLLSQMQDFVMEGGVYGTKKTGSAARQNKRKNKFVYIMKRIFLPFNEMIYTYPVLGKFPVLYPFIQVYRWFKFLFCPKTRRKAREELEFNSTITEEEKQKIADLCEKLGL